MTPENDATVVAVIPALERKITKLKAQLKNRSSESDALGIRLCIEAIEGMMTFATPAQYCEAKRWDRILRHITVMENRMKRGQNTAELEIGIEILIQNCGTP